MNKKYFLYNAIFIWAALLFNFFLKDIDAFWLFLIIPPVMGLLVYISTKQGGVVLPLFFMVCFPGIAISPAFLFLNRDQFSYSGFNAIGDFDFDIVEFLIIYAHLIFVLFLILFFSGIINRLLHIKINNSETYSAIVRDFDIIKSTDVKSLAVNLSSKKKFTHYTIAYIFSVLIPLNIWMYANGIGISAIEPPVLAYKLVGISFYFRNYISALIITYLYFRSGRGVGLVVLIFLYALFFGLMSVSKGSVVITCFPLLFFAYIDNKKVRFSLVAFGALTLYGFIAWVRQFVFLNDIGSLDMLNMVFNNVSFEMLNNIFDITAAIEAVSFRLSGANIYVLVYQYELLDNLSVIFDFYTNNWDALAETIYYGMFGLPPVSDGVVMGVGLGYLGMIFLLAGKSKILLTLLALITAFLISASDLIVKKYLNLGNNFYVAFGYGAAFIMALTLFEASMGKFYFAVAISLVGMIVLRYISKKTFN